MKKFMKNVLAVCLTASLAIVAVGCSDKTSPPHQLAVTTPPVKCQWKPFPLTK